MKSNYAKTLIGSAIAATCMIAATATTATAGQFHNGWNYAIDAIGDGSGGAQYDIYGMATMQTSDTIWVALTGGTPLAGVNTRSARSGVIGWGDLFFNFTGDDFLTASQNNALFGVRFAETNDSGASELGVYSNVRAKSVTSINNGYNSLQHYYNSGFYRQNTMGTDIATRQEAYDYFGQRTSIDNVIASGNLVGGINMHSQQELLNAGLDFGNFNRAGTHTFGFSFSKSLIGSGDYLASLFLECGNDGVALAGVSVPEPGTLAGLALLGVTFMGSKVRKGQKA
ncbi:MULTISPECIES: PEP-CTERM sorting domain-containing protein [Limnospira]|uniref:PEP-CTERM sorting domain-containing protein n=1 Tax=Limnospira TaxID=2596745 RepID=UPI00185FD45E|nr:MULTISPECIES: PEP-CTERM sorting domain-containing protein [Limnospira]MDT9196568.1 PEP-CTERM sorting domain-containing protein [Limnospira sp. PMC 1042.18]QNH58117.1 MAG: PEP-CTERM sorting domain-containing protein [Limnospira indica BM01]